MCWNENGFFPDSWGWKGQGVFPLLFFWLFLAELFKWIWCSRFPGATSLFIVRLLGNWALGGQSEDEFLLTDKKISVRVVLSLKSKVTGSVAGTLLPSALVVAVDFWDL